MLRRQERKNIMEPPVPGPQSRCPGRRTYRAGDERINPADSSHIPRLLHLETEVPSYLDGQSKAIKAEERPLGRPAPVAVAAAFRRLRTAPGAAQARASAVYPPFLPGASPPGFEARPAR